MYKTKLLVKQTDELTFKSSYYVLMLQCNHHKEISDSEIQCGTHLLHLFERVERERLIFPHHYMIIMTEFE